MAEQVKASRFTQLMSSLERFKTNKFLCDFTVKVGTKSLPAHRNILAASSKYFEALFQSNMKEVQDGFIDMKDVEPNAVELCIEFMYTGEAKITMTTIQDILRSSDLLQLDDLTDLCFEKLKENISPQNSLFAINLAQMYNRHDVKKHAEQTVIDNFNAVISSPMFPSISKSDFLHYMKASNESYQTKWKAVIEWTNGQKENTDDLFPELLASINIQNFPIKFTLEVVLREKLVKKNKTVKHSIIANMFSDIEKLKANLDITNCFILKELAETHQLANLTYVSKVVRNFLAKNFASVYERKEFLDIGKIEFVTFFQSPEMECSETVKYEAAVRWVKHDLRNRKKKFPALFKMIKLDKFSLDYLRDTVRTELMVKEFEECNDIMMNELFFRVATAKAGSTTPTSITAESLLTGVQEAHAVAANHNVESWREGGHSVPPIESDEINIKRPAQLMMRNTGQQSPYSLYNSHMNMSLGSMFLSQGGGQYNPHMNMLLGSIFPAHSGGMQQGSMRYQQSQDPRLTSVEEARAVAEKHPANEDVESWRGGHSVPQIESDEININRQAQDEQMMRNTGEQSPYNLYNPDMNMPPGSILPSQGGGMQQGESIRYQQSQDPRLTGVQKASASAVGAKHPANYNVESCREGGRNSVTQIESDEINIKRQAQLMMLNTGEQSPYSLYNPDMNMPPGSILPSQGGGMQQGGSTRYQQSQDPRLTGVQEASASAVAEKHPANYNVEPCREGGGNSVRQIESDEINIKRKAQDEQMMGNTGEQSPYSLYNPDMNMSPETILPSQGGGMQQGGSMRYQQSEDPRFRALYMNQGIRKLASKDGFGGKPSIITHNEFKSPYYPVMNKSPGSILPSQGGGVQQGGSMRYQQSLDPYRTLIKLFGRANSSQNTKH